MCVTHTKGTTMQGSISWVVITLQIWGTPSQFSCRIYLDFKKQIKLRDAPMIKIHEKLRIIKMMTAINQNLPDICKPMSPQ